jgi:hypothetical protein
VREWESERVREGGRGKSEMRKAERGERERERERERKSERWEKWDRSILRISLLLKNLRMLKLWRSMYVFLNKNFGFNF